MAKRAEAARMRNMCGRMQRSQTSQVYIIILSYLFQEGLGTRLHGHIHIDIDIDAHAHVVAALVLELRGRERKTAGARVSHDQSEGECQLGRTHLCAYLTRIMIVH